MADALAQHEIGLLQACEALQDAVYVKDLEGRYLTINAAGAAAAGLAPDELIGKTDRDVLPEGWEAIQRADREVIASGVSQTIEEALVIDGELRTYLSTKAPLRDSSGEAIGLIGISTDITARKAAEEELREREAKLVEAQTVAQVGSWEWDLTRDEASWSPELYRMFGVCPDEFEPTYESFLAAVHPEDRDRVAAALSESAESGADYEIEYRIVRPDGEIRTLIARACVFRDLDGEPVRMVGASLDVTERKRSHERLESREAMLEIAQELTLVGSFEWDVEADRVSWSGGLYRIFGLEPGAGPATFDGYLERVHPEEREERRSEIERVVRTGESAEGEHRIIRPDGEIRWVDSRVRALVDEAGGTTRLVGACQDITERKLELEQLELQMKDAHVRAMRDPLTGLANRTLTFERLEHACSVAQRRGADLPVLFIDIDGFKRVNDRFGHSAGDSVLRSVAERLRRNVRRTDTVSRIGGDEFLVICQVGETKADALKTAERLQAAFAPPFEVEGSDQQIQLRISIGTSSIGGRSLRGSDQLVREADAAMYEAKRRTALRPA
jgi:diguanylate cyclase (GGDEF)-like protein/PAS domain S-box-containing protein